MAGHSQFKNIMYRKGAQDKKRAKMFARLSREIMVAARSGLPDPDSNPRLRSAIQAARQQNMPKDNIERAIQRGGGGDTDSLEEIRYEGFGAGGISVIVEALTDNKNRTASEVRAAFTKHGGSLGETGSAAHLFDRVGAIHYPADAATADEMLEGAIDAGADDCESAAGGHDVYCAPDALYDVREVLAARFGEPESAELIWKPQALVPVGEDEADLLFKLLEALDESDDVQQVYANYEIDDAVMQKLTAA